MHFLAQNHVVWRISFKIHAGVSAVGDWKNQKSSKHAWPWRSEHLGVYFAYMGRRNPLTDWARFFLGGRYPWRNHARHIWFYGMVFGVGQFSYMYMPVTFGSDRSLFRLVAMATKICDFQHKVGSAYAADTSRCSHLLGDFRDRSI